LLIYNHRKILGFLPYVQIFKTMLIATVIHAYSDANSWPDSRPQTLDPRPQTLLIMPYTRIVTHEDLDGVVSAAVVSLATGIRQFFFTGPEAIQSGRTPTAETDIICDLPCPIRFGMWFDHHTGNLADVELRGLDPEKIPGKFSPNPSCARVVLEYFRGSTDFPPFMERTVDRTDRVDSFDYKTMEEWQEPLPEKLLADSIRAAYRNPRSMHRYLEKAVLLLQQGPMEDALSDPEVSDLVTAFGDMERRSLQLVDQDAFFHPDDANREVVIVDLTRHNRKPDFIRNTAFIRYPGALAVLLVQCRFLRGRKTNDLAFSMSLSFLMNTREHHRDIGEIMRSLNMGDGHPGAGGGRLFCRSKDEMIKIRGATLASILRMWKEMA